MNGALEFRPDNSKFWRDAVIAQDIMDRRFHTLQPAMTIREAVRTFRDATREEGKKVFGMLVTDDRGRLVGMLSMYGFKSVGKT
jgi:Mg/Co/Ni transporter MgtE